MTDRVVDILRAHMLPGPLPRPDLTLPDDRVPYTELAAWLQFDQLWRLMRDLEEHPDTTPQVAHRRVQRIFHDQDSTLHTRAQHACLATVTRYTLTLIDHAAATTTTGPRPGMPPTTGTDGREHLRGTRAIWAGQPDRDLTEHAAKISQRVDEIRKLLRDEKPR